MSDVMYPQEALATTAAKSTSSHHTLDFNPALEIAKIEKNPLNPNTMNEREFARLVKEIQEVGMIAPIQVWPTPHGTFQLIGGEHRMRACASLGHTTIPAMIIHDPKIAGNDQACKDLRNLITMRLNLIHGRVSPEKFSKLYMDLILRHPAELLQEAMGITDDKSYEKLLSSARLSVKQALDSVDKQTRSKKLQEFDKAASGAKTPEDLSNIISKVFTTDGNELGSHFLVFSYGGKDHIYVNVASEERFAFLHEKLRGFKENGIEPADVLLDLLNGYVPSAALMQDTAPEDPPPPPADESCQEEVKTA
jgi:hypothetical protein